MNNKIPLIKLSNGETIKAGESKKIINGELTLEKFIYGYDIASRTSIINHLIKLYKYKKYCEIGVRKGKNFNNIKIDHKVGVDPNPLFEHQNLYKLKSDNFFKVNKATFDIIFIDGLHLEDQVDKDIENSLSCISDKGIILLHDCNPPSKFHQRENYEVNGKFPEWNGTVWKSFVKLRISNPSLSLLCVNCDWGVGIIKKEKSKTYDKIENLNYEFLDMHRVELLNLISVKQFLERFK